MLTRLAPLALVMLAACSRAPDMATCRLVGRWELVDPNDGKSMEMRRVKRTPEENMHLQSLVTEVFRADGTWEQIGFKTFTGRTILSNWGVLEDADDRVKIEITYFKEDEGLSSRTYVFEGPDVAREDVAGGKTWIRVSSAN